MFHNTALNTLCALAQTHAKPVIVDTQSSVNSIGGRDATLAATMDPAPELVDHIVVATSQVNDMRERFSRALDIASDPDTTSTAVIIYDHSGDQGTIGVDHTDMIVDSWKTNPAVYRAVSTGRLVIIVIVNTSELTHRIFSDFYEDDDLGSDTDHGDDDDDVDLVFSNLDPVYVHDSAVILCF